MPISINGSGTITGISTGGLPDGIVDTDMIAANAVTAPKKGSGSILQVKSFTKTNTASFEISGTYFSNATQTGIQVSITPSNASNKILLFGQISIDVVGEQYNIGAAFEKAGSILTGSIADVDGNRKRVTSLGDGSTAAQAFPTIPLLYEDTAGGTSAITYGILMNNPSSISRIVYINRAVTDDDSIYRRRAVSSITAMEIAA